jgi:hypothetical protein
MTEPLERGRDRPEDEPPPPRFSMAQIVTAGFVAALALVILMIVVSVVRHA